MEDYRKTPLWDNTLSVEERLDYLVNELTLEEKITCLTTGCPDIERLGIKAFYMGGEAAHGIEARHDQAFNAGEAEPTTSFTQPIGMSASFDRELIKECGKAVGEEARALYTRNGGGGLCRWAPTIDMERDPRWGRTEEAYGEDPYLTGEMSSAYIRGMRGEHPFYLQCGATLKHFYANNVEKDRIKISSSLDERNKQEYYLEPFRKAIVEGGAEAIMTSYNEINGVPAIVNPEVQNLLKDKWGLPGHVVCDGGDFGQTVQDHKYFATHAETIAYGLKAGVDCFTDDSKIVFPAAREALAKGLITEDDINRSIRNSFCTRIRLGLYDGAGDCPYTGMGEEYINSKAHQDTCRKMAEETVVLLKNKGDLLPLDNRKTGSLAVVGPLADVWYKDWYCGIPPYQVTVLDGMRRNFPNTAISYHSGLSKIRLRWKEKYVGVDESGRIRLTGKEQAETFLFTDWGCGNTTLQAGDGRFVTLEEKSDIIKVGKKEAFSWFIREAWDFIKKEKGYALQSWDDRTVCVDGEGYLTVESAKEESIFTMEVVEDGVAEATALAAQCEKAVVVLGCNPVINSKEEIDRTTLALPPAQQFLVDKVVKANPNTIVVLVTNYPYSIEEIQEKVPAILCSASGSQEMGNGIAAVLSGKASPAGRLPMTWYRKDEDLPDINDYDIIQGKRTYQYFDGEVLYPFGYGLSYTRFSYGEMQVVPGKENVKITLSVTNEGEVAGDEVVQLYVRQETSRVKQPISRLQAFERVKNIQPGETRTVTFVVDYEQLRYYDVISETMILESGDYVWMAGASSKDIRQQQRTVIEGTTAPDRDLFRPTKAVQYDAYENCFIHRGTKAHTMDGSTCVIPGKPGDEPDSAPKSDTASEEKLQAELWYRDVSFSEKPGKIRLRLCAVEEGSVTLFCENAGKRGTVCKISVKTSENLEFQQVKEDLPEDFADLSQKQTLHIVIEGKVKLAEFQMS